jgi:hypothetical protein
MPVKTTALRPEHVTVAHRKGVTVMAGETLSQEVASIGAVAGLVWQYLDRHGPTTYSRLVKDLDASRDLIMQGIGWLAREGKVTVEETPKCRMIERVRDGG